MSSLLPPLQAEAGGQLDLLAHLRQLQSPGQIGEWNVRLTGMAHPARVCALRKSEEAIQRAQRRLAHLASKKQTKTRPETREYAQYVVVFTTDLSGAKETILAWYRVRWQIELAFKRLKSLARGSVDAEYEALREQLLDSLQPVGFLQDLTVQRLQLLQDVHFGEEHAVSARSFPGSRPQLPLPPQIQQKYKRCRGVKAPPILYAA